MSYSVGLDFGTNSVRALIVDCVHGHEVANAVANYPSGHQGILLDGVNHHLARQNPTDYLSAMRSALTEAFKVAESEDPFCREKVIAIGVDSTGSSPLPVDSNCQPLAFQERFRKNLNAQCWLWKDHTSHWEATQITQLAREHRPAYLAKCGNTYSSEWWWAKLWHCLRVDREVFQTAHTWVELCDYIPAVLAGITDPKKIKRSICAAGHKALYHREWGGLPDQDFLRLLDPQLATLSLYDEAVDVSQAAGQLSLAWAETLGLPAGITIGMGAFDVHLGAIGCGIQPGVLVKVIGTSTCDCAVSTQETADIPGICGIVPGSILPDCYGIEAGQSAVGDIFKWFVEVVCQNAKYEVLEAEAAKLTPGQSGLLALDWNNGNRTILVDPLLSGLLMGQTLHTTPAEIYRALIEATAFGARTICERLRDYHVPIEKVLCCGGIAEKSPLVMQIYADVLGVDLQVTASLQACALGAAIASSVAAGQAHGGHNTFQAAQLAMSAGIQKTYSPNASAVTVYKELYALYRQLHDAFGGVTPTANLSALMKQLIAIKEREAHV